MGKVFFAVVVAIASFALVESLVCNKCAVSLFGACLGSGNETCNGNNQTCYVEKITFPALSSFGGVIRQGCRLDNATCKISNSTSILGIQVKSEQSCCTADGCNTVSLIAAAPDLKMTFLVTMVGAAMASMWGSVL